MDVNNDPLPLTNCKVVMEVFNEDDDPMTAVSFLTFELEGPDIPPGSDHLFEMIIPAKTIIASGIYQLKFRFYADVDGNDMSDNPIFNLSYSFCGISYETAKEKVMEYADDAGFGDYQVVMMPQDPLAAGTVLESLNAIEVSHTLSTSAYFAWLMSDMYSAFEQPTRYILLDPFSCEITTFEANWWPLIDGEEYSPSLIAADVIIKPEITEDELEEIIFIGEPQNNDSKSCAILVAGRDNTIIDQEILPRAIQSYKNNLIKNPLGPQLQEDQIVLMDRKTKEEIMGEIEKTQEGYDCVYFYYVGHGGSKENGNSLISNHDEPGKRYNHKDLVEDLLDSEATKFRIIMDCCYAGQFIDEVKANPKSEGKDIQILTSSARNKSALIQVSNRGNQSITGLWIFSHYMNTFSGDPSSDINGDGKVDLVEINRQILENNPFFISSRESFVDPTCPQFFGQLGMEQVRNIINVNADDPENTLGEEQVVTVFPEMLEAGTKIESFSPEELSLTLEKPIYVGWSVTNPFNDFEQPSKLFLLDPETQETTVMDLSWWLKINGQNWFPSFYGSETLNPLTPIEDLPEIPDLEIQNPYDNPKVCALLINGLDATQEKTDIYKQDVSWFERNLKNAKNGPRLLPSQIIVRSGITKDSIQMLMKELQIGYDIIYFYYRGHGTKDGRMATGNMPSEFYSFEEFAEDILSSEATDINVMIDCCYSGNAIVALNNNPKSCFKNIEISTSSTFDKSSRTIFGRKNGESFGYGIHSYNFSYCFTDPSTDKNGDGRNSFYETSQWIEEIDPVDPLDNKPSVYQCPQKLEKIYDRFLYNGQYLDMLRNELGEEVVNNSNINVDILHLDPGIIESIPNFTLEKSNNSGIIVINQNASELFPKDFKIATIELGNGCSEPLINTHDIEEGGIPRLIRDGITIDFTTLSDKIHTGDMEILPASGQIQILEENLEMSTNEKRGGMIIENIDPALQFANEDLGLNRISSKYANEKHGPYISNENLTTFNLYKSFLPPSSTDICKTLEDAEGNYCHFYFHLTGNGSGDGGLSFSVDSGFISYTELFNKLAAINADTLTIILETGSRPEVIQAAVLNSDLANVEQVYIQTSSTPESDGRLLIDTDEEYTIGALTSNIYSKIGALEYNLNDDLETNHFEAFIGYRREKLEFETEMGQLLSAKGESDPPGVFDLSNLNISILENPADNHVRIENNFGEWSEIESLPSNVILGRKRFMSFSESSNFRNNSITGMVTFKLDSLLDAVDSDDGILGLIFRESDSEDWETLENVVYDAVNNTLTTDTMTLQGDFIIASIDEMSSAVKDINSSSIELKALPSLFDQVLNLQFILKENKKIKFNIVNLEGRIVHSIDERLYPDGQHKVTIDSSNFSSGIYIVQLIEDNNRSKLLMLTKI